MITYALRHTKNNKHKVFGEESLSPTLFSLCLFILVFILIGCSNSDDGNQNSEDNETRLESCLSEIKGLDIVQDSLEARLEQLQKLQNRSQKQEPRRCTIECLFNLTYNVGNYSDNEQPIIIDNSSCHLLIRQLDKKEKQLAECYLMNVTINDTQKGKLQDCRRKLNKFQGILDDD